jgi:hypothetical protein
MPMRVSAASGGKTQTFQIGPFFGFECVLIEISDHARTCAADKHGNPDGHPTFHFPAASVTTFNAPTRRSMRKRSNAWGGARFR